MHSHDAAKPEGFTFSEETGEERLCPAKFGHHQGAEEGEATRERNYQWGDNNEDSSNEVRFASLDVHICTNEIIRRPGTSDFIAHQLQIMAAMQAEHEQRAKEKLENQRKLQRPKHHPPVPPLPVRDQ